MFETYCSPFSSLPAYQGKVARNIGCSTDRPLDRVNITFNLQLGLGQWKTPTTTCPFSHRCLVVRLIPVVELAWISQGMLRRSSKYLSSAHMARKVRYFVDATTAESIASPKGHSLVFSFGCPIPSSSVPSAYVVWPADGISKRASRSTV